MKHSYKIPCSTAHLKKLRLFLGEVLSGLNLENIDQNSLILAVDEVCANIIIHSNCDEGESIEMNVIPSKKEIIFEIIDGASSG
ncbi:MAG: ATP-binding protein, partial [Saprospiraceae bacterium]|nr:ATP-binding protein [Saprospiraceae bacterium]